MSDHDLSLLEVAVALRSTGNAHASVFAPTAAGEVTAWQVSAATMDGTIVATYDQAQVANIIWGVDVPEQATFTIPIDAPDLDLLPLTGGNSGSPDYETFNPVHEVKIYRNGALLFWGPCVTRRANSQTRQWTYTAYGPLWYLTHRYIGQASRHDYLQPDNSESDWTGFGSLTKTDDTDRYVISPSSIELVAAGVGTNYIYRRFVQTSTTIGLALILTAWLYVDDLTHPSTGAFGMQILRIGASGAGSSFAAPLDVNTPRGIWTRLSGAILMPPSVTETIEVRLYAPEGTVHWDAMTVTIEESVSLIDANSPGGTGWDQVQIAQQVVRYASGAWAVGPSYRKSDLHLAVAGAASGILKERTYQFFDHQPIYQGGTGSGALDEWPKALDGFDYRVDITPSTRTFRTYYPAVGVEWDPDTIIFTYVNTNDDDAAGTPNGSSIGVVGWDWGETIEGSATDVCELGGWGDGAGREEGGAEFDDLGDLTLELVEAAPNEAPVDLLNSIAEGRQSQLGQILFTPTLTMVEPKDPETQEVLVPLIGILMPGDVIPFLLHDGSVVFDDGSGGHTFVRVTQVSLSGDDVLTVSIAASI